MAEIDSNAIQKNSKVSRFRLQIKGLVQGVGFRPYMYRLARKFALNGWIKNTPAGITLELEGDPAKVKLLISELESNSPPQSRIDAVTKEELPPVNHKSFIIRSSEESGATDITVPPDLALCDDCRRELFDAADRRYRYPFINCTNCGPRYSIIEAMPYDRPATTMKNFRLCRTCEAEYNDPANRRFHAQPVACPECGPRLEFLNSKGIRLGRHDRALEMSTRAILEGAIVAVKGLGGFQLIVRADAVDSIRHLRHRKHRPHKPFALMYPDLASARIDCQIDEEEEKYLLSAAAPIVLLQRRSEHSSAVAENVAPGIDCLGVMLPYTPLHWLIMDVCRVPLIATSGNLSGEPLCIDENEALLRLQRIADFFLIHNRPIVRPVDDSVVQVINGKLQMIRLARGFAPLEISGFDSRKVVLGTGGHLKNSLAIATGKKIISGQHIGDLDSNLAQQAWDKCRRDLTALYRQSVDSIACDLHPDYASTHMTKNSDLPVARIPHHLAHVLNVALENKIEGRYIGVSWDGAGYGTDGSVWGGEFLQVDGRYWSRLAHWRPLPLPGNEAAIRQPGRIALAILREISKPEVYFDDAVLRKLGIDSNKAQLVLQMVERDINTPVTSSAGRLFDSAAALLGLCRNNSFEGRAAMRLEATARGNDTTDIYAFNISTATHPWIIDWQPLFTALQNDIVRGKTVDYCAAVFHNTMAAAITEVIQKTGEKTIVLAGGCFQNRILILKTTELLEKSGCEVYRGSKISPNDGSLAIGQIVAAVNKMEQR